MRPIPFFICRFYRCIVEPSKDDQISCDLARFLALSHRANRYAAAGWARLISLCLNEWKKKLKKVPDWGRNFRLRELSSSPPIFDSSLELFGLNVFTFVFKVLITHTVCTMWDKAKSATSKKKQSKWIIPVRVLFPQFHLAREPVSWGGDLWENSSLKEGFSRRRQMLGQ